MPSPVLWGDEKVVRERFGSVVSALTMTRRHYLFTYPFPPSEVVELFRQCYGADESRVRLAQGSRCVEAA